MHMHARTHTQEHTHFPPLWPWFSAISFLIARMFIFPRAIALLFIVLYQLLYMVVKLRRAQLLLYINLLLLTETQQ